MARDGTRQKSFFCLPCIRKQQVKNEANETNHRVVPFAASIKFVEVKTCIEIGVEAP